MTIHNLSAAIKKLRERIPVAVNEATKEVAIEILSVAASNTPVDTTKAISNWQIGVGSAPSGVVPPHVPGSAGSTKGQSLAITVDKGKAKLVNRKVGSDIHVTNNADHIDGLNDGTISKQPGQFVQKAELAGTIKIANTKLRLT